MASLSLGAGKVEMKWEVGMRSKKKKKNILMLFTCECLQNAALNGKDNLL